MVGVSTRKNEHETKKVSTKIIQYKLVKPALPKYCHIL